MFATGIAAWRPLACHPLHSLSLQPLLLPPQNLAEAAPLLATPAAAKANAPQLQHLAVWAPLPLLDAISLAAGPAGRHPAVLGYVMRSLQSCPPEEVAFFLPQLVQVSGAWGRLVWGWPHWLRAGQLPPGVAPTCPAPPVCSHASHVLPPLPHPLNLHPQLVRYDQGGLVERFLLDAAQRSVYFAHMLICQLLSEGTPPEEAFNPAVRGQGRRGGRMDRHGLHVHLGLAEKQD